MKLHSVYQWQKKIKTAIVKTGLKKKKKKQDYFEAFPDKVFITNLGWSSLMKKCIQYNSTTDVV